MSQSRPPFHRAGDAHRRIEGLRRRKDAEFFGKHLRSEMLDARLAEAPRNAHLDAGAYSELFLRAGNEAAVMTKFEGFIKSPASAARKGKSSGRRASGTKRKRRKSSLSAASAANHMPPAHAEDEGADENKTAAAEAHHARGTAERHFERMAGGEDIQHPQPDKGRRRNEAGKRTPQKGEAQREEGDEQELGKREKGVAAAQHVVLVEIPAEEPLFAVSALLQYPEHGRHAKAHDEPRRGRPRKDG